MRCWGPGRGFGPLGAKHMLSFLRVASVGRLQREEEVHEPAASTLFLFRLVKNCGSSYFLPYPFYVLRRCCSRASDVHVAGMLFEFRLPSHLKLEYCLRGKKQVTNRLGCTFDPPPAGSAWLPNRLPSRSPPLPTSLGKLDRPGEQWRFYRAANSSGSRRET